MNAETQISCTKTVDIETQISCKNERVSVPKHI